jgi:hypothetical protein
LADLERELHAQEQQRRIDEGRALLEHASRRPTETHKAPDDPIKTSGHEPPTWKALCDAMDAVARTYSRDARPAEKAIWKALQDRLGSSVTRQRAREVLIDRAKHLKGKPGYRSKS